MHLYIVFGILLIVPIVDFALAAPVLVQEKRQAFANMAHIPKYPVTVLGKRGGIDDLGDMHYIKDWFANPEESSAALPSSSSPPSASADHGQVDVKQPLPPVPEWWSPMPSPDHAPSSPVSSTESEYEDALPGPSSPASSTMSMSDADYELVGAHAPPNPGPSTESDHESTAVHAPLSSAVLPTWFLTDHGFIRPHAPSTEFDSDHMLAVEEPPSRPVSPTTEFDADHEYQMVDSPPPSQGPASPTESDHEMVEVPPSSPV
ncbi:hypothetical protein F5888DRAFT_1718434, partial [Russula emetica]